jgi:insertion element IS1 protein InsB
MNNLLSCPQCGLSHSQRNGHTHYGKQNHQCLHCGRQFVEDSQRITAADRAMIKRLLLERLSLLGICRVMGISLRWLLSFIAEVYEALPDDLNVRLPQSLTGQVKLLRLQAEADEMWSFVGASRTSNGYGSPLMAPANKSLLSTSVIAAAKALASCGSESR